MAMSNKERAQLYRIRKNGLKLRLSVREIDTLLRMLKDSDHQDLRKKIDEQATEHLRDHFIKFMDGIREGA
jgi:hypothetical protein